MQPDGKIVAGGGGALTTDFAFVRYNTDGTPDTTFGAGGTVTTDLGGSDYVPAVALQPDGRIVAAGSAFGRARRRGSSARSVHFGGSLDPSFGAGGKVTTSFGGTHEVANAVAVQPDGKIGRRRGGWFGADEPRLRSGPLQRGRFARRIVRRRREDDDRLLG